MDNSILIERLEQIVEWCVVVETMESPHPAAQRIELNIHIACDLLNASGHVNSEKKLQQAAEYFERGWFGLINDDSPRAKEDVRSSAKTLCRVTNVILRDLVKAGGKRNKKATVNSNQYLLNRCKIVLPEIAITVEGKHDES
jgi:hypothetical protein